MMQEAKPSCRGRWYLPAGRMEAGETVEVCGPTVACRQHVGCHVGTGVQEGVRREVEEETGLVFQPRSIICVEVRVYHTVWVRFTVIGA